MARIKGKNTKPELMVAAILDKLKLTPEQHPRDIAGRPDFILRDIKLAIFVDGDFWHGWRFPQWRLKLSEKWENKIDTNRRRDARNHARLRRSGWFVLRIWEHQLQRDQRRVSERITAAVVAASVQSQISG